ncbi:MAG: YjjG family noncanonical pyrimidine nucleotidase [Bacteroidales bacterium]|nr:YjjG family noncanonical pyrimidine nucleotidase [Bacteroidales bacterium]
MQQHQKNTKKYSHIFFDLDRTIYDFDKSSYHTFMELYARYDLYSRGIPSLDTFYDTYKEINAYLWELYKKGKMEKEFLNVQRFYLTLLEFGVEDRTLAAELASGYLKESPLKPFLFPHSREVLGYLKEKYTLHIITNGFEEVQADKIRANDLGKYFSTITTSEEAGVKKPFPGIFKYALGKAGAEPEESLMIGDDIEVDILGAKSAGMDQMFFNSDRIKHKEEITFEIASMKEITGIL